MPFFPPLLKILDKLLDRESQTHKPQTLSSFYSSSKPTVANQKSPSKHAAQSAAAIQQLPGASVTQQAAVSTAVQSSPENFVEKSTQGKKCFVTAMLKFSIIKVYFPNLELDVLGLVSDDPLSNWKKIVIILPINTIHFIKILYFLIFVCFKWPCLVLDRERRWCLFCHCSFCAESSQRSPCEPAAEATVLKQEGKVPSRLALGNRGGYNGRCWGSPVRQKKKHTGGNGLAPYSI